MIKPKGLTELLALICWSDYLELEGKETVLSAIIKAPVERGKTSYVEQFVFNDGVARMTDCTMYGLLGKNSEFRRRLLKGQIKRLIIPDLINVSTRKAETVNNLFNFIKDFCSSDGVGEIVNYAMTFRPGEGNTIKGGVLTTIANEDFGRVHRLMAQQGLLSRLLVISYDYSQELARQVLDDISYLRYDWSPIKLDFPAEKQAVHLPGILAARMIPLAEYIGRRLSGIGARAQHQMRVLAKCSALSEGRDVVCNLDIERVTDMALAYLGMDNKLVDRQGEVQLTLEDQTIKQKVYQGEACAPLFDYAGMPVCFRHGVCVLLSLTEKDKLPPKCDPDRCLKTLQKIAAKLPDGQVHLTWANRAMTEAPFWSHAMAVEVKTTPSAKRPRTRPRASK